MKYFKARHITSPSSSSWQVSTPYLGSLSPVKELACISGFFTPWMWDMDTLPAAPMDVGWHGAVGAAATDCSTWPLLSLPPATAAADTPARLLDTGLSFFLSRSPSSTRRLGMSRSCCWSVEESVRLAASRRDCRISALVSWDLCIQSTCILS